MAASRFSAAWGKIRRHRYFHDKETPMIHAVAAAAARATRLAPVRLQEKIQ
jgi:hypothetical protein